MRRAAAMIGIASRAPDTTSRVFAGARSVCMARRARQPRGGSPPRACIGRARRGLEARRLGARPDGREPGVLTRGRHALPRGDDRGRGAGGGLLPRRHGAARSAPGGRLPRGVARGGPRRRDGLPGKTHGGADRPARGASLGARRHLPRLPLPPAPSAGPTGALGPGYTMDPRRCLSYLPIEHRSAIPAELRPHLDNWIFGCDLCQEACPWNADVRDAAGAEALAPHLPSLLALDEAGFRARFGKTAVARAKRRGLLRNTAVAVRSRGNPDALPALAAALADPEPLVRGHAAWALGRLGGASARRALEAARERETDGGAAAEIGAALALP